MQKFKVVGDPNNDNNKNCSSYIIISSLNEAARKLDLYSDDQYKFCYDTLGNTHGHTDINGQIVVYELFLTNFIMSNVYPRLMVGVSRDNQSNFIESGYPVRMTNWFPLGVNSKKWPYLYKNPKTKRILALGEGNVRGGLELAVEVFCEEFRNSDSVELYIRDRSASGLFKAWVEEQASAANVKIIHDDRDLTSAEEEQEVWKTCSFALIPNKCSTWNCRLTELLAAGVPTIAMAYQGHREQIVHERNGLEIPFCMSEINRMSIEYLKGIGLRHHFLPLDSHIKPPQWSIPIKSDLKIALHRLLDDSGLRNKLSIGARVTAETLTWERSAAILSSIAS